jgi:acetyl-CoA carboxylase biotin carboxyl carrier protein
MSELSYDDVRKILAIVENSTVDELHVELGDFKLDVRRHGAPVTAHLAVASMENAAASAPAPQAASPPPASPAVASPPREIELAPGQFVVVAPMLGTFYRSSAPDAPPYNEVGSEVAPEDPLCIIEVMKLMNTITATRAGRVAAILVENAAMVEFGQSLIVLDPL